MKEETYRPWRPLGATGRMYCDRLIDDDEGFRVILRPEDPTASPLRISFESPIGYRNVNESYRLRLWARESWKAIAGELFYTVLDSSWIEWLKSEAAGVLESEDLVHYAIFTPEDCIEVVSAFEPTFEWM